MNSTINPFIELENCKYCHEPFQSLNSADGSTNTFACLDDENCLCFDDCEDDTLTNSCEINYCPMCGRKLGD
jgi:hypothetical protein